MKKEIKNIYKFFFVCKNWYVVQRKCGIRYKKSFISLSIIFNLGREIKVKRSNFSDVKFHFQWNVIGKRNLHLC